MKKGIVSLLVAVMVCISLAGCAGADYKKAVEYMEAGDYPSAIELLEKIPDYEDASAKLNTCKGILAAIETLNTKNTELDTAIAEANQLVKDERKALKEERRTELETAVTEARAEKITPSAEPVDLDALDNTIKEYNNVNYSAVLQDLQKKQDALDKSIQQYELVNNPSEKYVIKCLKKVPHITGISAVTEDNDPNGHLNKEGGYTAQVYFSSDLVDQTQVLGDSIIDRGTDGGGSIEVYKTEEDAIKRKEYLSAFDGSILSSGSHTVVGTVLVRTSDKLTATQQKKMEARIIKTLTALK